MEFLSTYIKKYFYFLHKKEEYVIKKNPFGEFMQMVDTHKESSQLQNKQKKDDDEVKSSFEN